jgi:hypothetical protein
MPMFWVRKKDILTQIFFQKFSKLVLSLSCGLYYKSLTIVIYDPI